MCLICTGGLIVICITFCCCCCLRILIHASKCGLLTLLISQRWRQLTDIVDGIINVDLETNGRQARRGSWIDTHDTAIENNIFTVMYIYTVYVQQFRMNGVWIDFILGRMPSFVPNKVLEAVSNTRPIFRCFWLIFFFP